MGTEKKSVIPIQEQQVFYNKHWAHLKPFGSYKVARVARIMGFLNDIRKVNRNPEIVDLGCGDGRGVSVWSLFGNATGFDLSPSAIERAKELFPAISFYSGDALKTQFDDNSFDVVISQEVIEHIEMQVDYITECSRLIKGKGYLILTTPNKYYFDRVKGGNYSRQPIENIISLTVLKKLIKTKFEIIKIDSVVVAKGDFGVYKFLSSPILLKLLNLSKLEFIRRYFMEKNILGVHICILARKL